MAGDWLPYLLGTIRSVFKVGKATFDASGLAAARTFALPDKAGTVAMLDDVAIILSGTAASNLLKGTPVYMSLSGSMYFDVATGSNAAAGRVIGMAIDSVSGASPVRVQCGGIVTLTTSEWDTATGGSGGLSVGEIYCAGGTSNLHQGLLPAPNGPGLIPVGVALSSTQLLLLFSPSVLARSILYFGSGSTSAELDASGNTAGRVYSLPDKTGTFALLDDVPQGIVSLTAAASLSKVSPVYISGAGAIDKAKADAASTAAAIGLTLAAIGSSAQGQVQTTGIVTAATGDWDAITGGSGGLTANALYFVSPSTAGALTTTVPTTPGQLISPVGRALSTTQMSLRISEPVLL